MGLDAHVECTCAAQPCAHPRQKLIDQRISSWSGYRALQQALDTMGWGYFPTLHLTLPEGNGGETHPFDSAACLRELAAFEARYQLDEPILVDSRTELIDVDTHHRGVLDALIAVFEASVASGQPVIWC